MTLTVDKKPHDDIYLRGFVGTKYEKGKWSTSKTSVAVEDYFAQDTCYQLLTQDYSLYQANEAAEDGEKELSQVLSSGTDLSGTNDMSMTIKYLKNNLSTFAYFPYYAKLDNDSMGLLMLDYDRGFRRSRSVKEYKITMQRTNSTGRSRVLSLTNIMRTGIVPYFINDNTNLMTKMGSDDTDSDHCTVFETGKKDIFETKSYASLEVFPKLLDDSRYVSVTDETIAKYLQYVMGEDLWLPSKGLARTKQLAKQLMTDGTVELSVNGESRTIVEDIIRQMQQYFADETSYSTSLESVGTGEDYVENFLFTQKKGYCEHYATAGAVLFRAMGVPARYVSGYKVSAEDFSKNEDGTYTAKVVDSNAHAWTELYTLNAGWTVADMTPSSDGDGGESTSSLADSEEDDGDDEFLENDSDAAEKASSQGDDQEEETPEPKVTAQPTSQAAQAPQGGL
jgi:hypothetical protein